MNNLAIAIVSGGRAGSLFERAMTPRFLGNMPWFLYVHAEELRAYERAVDEASAKNVTIRPIPDELDYHQSLDYAVSDLYLQGFEKAFIADDDRVIDFWPNQSLKKSHRAEPEEVERCLLEMANVCSDGIPLVGCRLRGFCWKDNTPLTLAGKCVGMQMLYLPRVVNRFKFSWKAKSMHDHHMLAQILSEGLLAVTYNKLLHDDRFGHMHSSGCGRWRTVKMHSDAAKLMEHEFPNAVRSRFKSYVNGEPLYDIVFTASRLLDLHGHIRLFGNEYLNQIQPFLNEKQQDMIDVAIQDYSVQ